MKKKFVFWRSRLLMFALWLLILHNYDEITWNAETITEPIRQSYMNDVHKTAASMQTERTRIYFRRKNINSAMFQKIIQLCFIPLR